MTKRKPMFGLKVLRKPPKNNASLISQKGKMRKPITLAKTEKPK